MLTLHILPLTHADLDCAKDPDRRLVHPGCLGTHNPRSIRALDTELLQIVAVGFSVSICVGTAYGLGLHTKDIPSHSEVSLRKAQYAFSVLYVSMRFD